MLILILLILLLLLLFYLLNKSKFNMISNKYTDAKKLGKFYINSILKDQSLLNDKGIINNYAVMFDIDDTLISTDNGHIIKPIKDLLDFCINKGLLIIIITARDNIYKKQTIQELNKHSINYSGLYLHEGSKTIGDFNNFKSNIKKNLFETYKIKTIMSVGDQNIDIIGKYSGYGLKLPNKTDPNLYEITSVVG